MSHNLFSQIGFNRMGPGQLSICIHLGNHDQVLRTAFEASDTKGNRPSSVDRRMPRDQLLDIRGMNIPAPNDDDVVEATQDIQLTIVEKSNVAGFEPALLDAVAPVGALEIPAKETITSDPELTDLPLPESTPGPAADFHLGMLQAGAG